MKQLVAFAANHCAAYGKDIAEILPQVEVIVVVAEPEYTFDETGDVIRQRKVSQCRFVCSPDQLRGAAKSLGKWADEAEEYSEKLNHKDKQ